MTVVINTGFTVYTLYTPKEDNLSTKAKVSYIRGSKWYAPIVSRILKDHLYLQGHDNCGASICTWSGFMRRPYSQALLPGPTPQP